MTTLQKHKTDREELKELLIKNLPSKIKGGNEKNLSNIYDYQTAIALDKCKFINFNSQQRISIMIFDIDKYKDKTAKEYFNSIDGFFEFISEKIGLEPTYILETAKGYHFAYHLKNHVFTHQQKSLKYLLDIKRAITKLIRCDEIASHRLWGVWRNPLLHPCYYSKQINYELSDFKELIPKVEYKNKSIRTKIEIDENELIQGQRNNTLFKYAMKFAKGQTIITTNDILIYLQDINTNKNVNLENNELLQISTSVYKYWSRGTILFGKKDNNKDINEGVMNFVKMRGLNYDEYLEETKKRQTLSALRTNQIRDEDKNKKQLLKAKRLHYIKTQERNIQKILEAVEIIKEENKKITFSHISRLTGLDRRTVKKYY